MNNISLMGRLTADPELKTTGSGISVVSFTIAVPRRFQPKDGDKITDFINCVAWRQTAEFICKYFSKGDPLAITGEIQTRKYEVDGNKRTATEVIISQAYFCGSKNGGNNADNEPAAAEFGDSFGQLDDDLPF